ncbi:MAG: hypothetical protein AB8B62_16375 [Roseobacter sp.]
MIPRTGLILMLVVLAACGVDGEPERPNVGASIALGSGGSSSVGVGVSQGPFSVFLGL